MVKRRKIVASFVGALLLIAAALPAAAGSTLQWKLEQYTAKMPQIDLYLNAVDEDGNPVDLQGQIGTERVLAALGDQTLQVDAFEQYQGGTVYYVLTDVSGSIDDSSVKAVRECLAGWVNALSGEDRVVLLSFGSEVKLLLNGSEDRATAQTVIGGITATDKKTLFFEALDKAIEYSQDADSAFPKRSVMLVFTDGKDVSDGGSVTLQETADKLKSASMPLYAFGIGNNKTYLDALGELSRNTGGDIQLFSGKTAQDAATRARNRINSCYHLRLTAANNIVDATKKQLILKINDGETERSVSAELQLKDWIADTVLPEVSRWEKIDQTTIELEFSEPVLQADNPANYRIEWTGADEAGAVSTKQIDIAGVTFDQKNRTAQVSAAQPLQNGRYTLTLLNVTDVSMERNALHNQQLPFEVTDVKPVEKEPEEEAAFPWWIVVAGAVVVAGVVTAIVLAAKRRKASKSGDRDILLDAAGDKEKINIHSAVGCHVCINILEPNGLQRTLQTFVGDTFVIGRSSSSCDLSIDDKQLSRQHCRLYYMDGGLFIADLNSTNGTEVNNIRIQNPRRLMNGDAIGIGNCKLIVQWIAEQS